MVDLCAFTVLPLRLRFACIEDSKLDDSALLVRSPIALKSNLKRRFDHINLKGKLHYLIGLLDNADSTLIFFYVTDF